jgi:hypothetical protein
MARGVPKGSKTVAGRVPCEWTTSEIPARPFHGVACPQGMSKVGIAGPGEPPASPRPPVCHASMEMEENSEMIDDETKKLAFSNHFSAVKIRPML